MQEHFRVADSSTYIIAEMACSHDGDARLARKIIDGAGNAGANAIQFQIWVLADMVVGHHPSYPMLQKLELSPGEWRDLALYTRTQHPDMDIIACVSERASADLAEEIDANAYKVHAGDLSNHQLLQHVARTNRRIDLSVGASTQDEILRALRVVREVSEAEVWLMYGYQTFPTPIDAIHLRYMQTLQSRFDLRVGYQDHSDAESDAAFYLPAVATGLGICIQEKHITHDRRTKGADHHSALNPDEFARFVGMLREIETALGSDAPRIFSEEEETYRKYAKKSIVAARDLPEGHLLVEEDVLCMRADDIGIPPDDIGRLLGKDLKRPIPYQCLITKEDIA